jgi:hypothetical protein
MADKRTKVEFLAASEEPVPFKPTKKDPKVDLGAVGGNVVDAVLAHSEDDFLPWEEIQLPSLGYYYPTMPDGKVKVRPMGITAEKILSTQRLAATGKSIDLMLRRCVQFPKDFNTDDLLTGDKNFLFFYIRGITYGPDYDFLFTCSDKQCARATEYEGSLHDVTVKQADSKLGAEPFKVVLPNLSAMAKQEVWVKLRLMRNKDSRDIFNQIPTTKRYEDLDATLDEALTGNISRVITEVGTDQSSTNDPDKIKQFIDRLHSGDAKTIDAFITEATPGIDTKVRLVCKHCSNEMTGELPITESFLRPSK